MCTVLSAYKQVLFYVNAGIVGTDGQTWVSLYLACEVGSTSEIESNASSESRLPFHSPH